MNDLTTLTTKICVMPSAGGCLLTLRDSISKRLRENRACGKMRHSYNPRENIAEDAMPNDVDRLRVLTLIGTEAAVRTQRAGVINERARGALNAVSSTDNVLNGGTIGAAATLPAERVRRRINSFSK